MEGNNSMILYYIKITFRNYLNNKKQSLVTLFSMAFAFALASLATYWNHYEQTYDSFLTNYENIYLVGRQKQGDRYISRYSTYELHSHLMNQYAEIEKSCGIKKEWEDDRKIDINNRTVQTSCDAITPGTIDIFDIQWIEGNQKIESWNENEVAVSEEIARKVCGKDSPIGLSLNLKDENGEETESEYKIVAVFKTWPKHSNFDFHIIKKLEPSEGIYCYTYVCLRPNTGVNELLQKIIDNPFQKDYLFGIIYNVLTPLQEVHYTFSEKERNIRLHDVKLFTGASILLVLCSLLNYLNLFIIRLRTKGREMALRTICGSSSWQLGMLLMVEYLLLMLGALFFSMIFIELFYNEFVEFSQLEIDRFTIYVGCAYLLLFILALAALLSLVPIFYFKKKTLRVQMEVSQIQLGKNRLRIAGVCAQLFISILFIFCASIMIKQVHYLIHSDIHIERKNIAWIRSTIGDVQIKDIIKQIPQITEMVSTNTPLFPDQNVHLESYKTIEGKDNHIIPAYRAIINQDIADFYRLNMKEGIESFNLSFNEYLINETFAQQMNDPNPIGKTLWFGGSCGIIRGIVYDYQYQPPTEPIRALVFEHNYFRRIQIIAFKYTGDFTACQAAIKKAFERAEVNIEYDLKDGETVYNSYLTSEFNLLKLLNIVTIISILIALFGVYALILQECEHQRKNIAIRKVYGAQAKDILTMFFKKYMMQVVIAALFAFPIGYVLMKHWLEGYSRQTSIGIEVFLGIFICVALLVSLCIGWHVWRAANENPATVIKKE